MNWDDEDDRGPAVARRPAPMPNNFVAPAAPLALRPRVEVLPPAAHEVQPVQPVTHDVRMTTTHVDRAKAFSITSIPLAAALGVVAFLVAVALLGVPLMSGVALVTLFVTFGLVWLAAWIWFNVVSPDGVALMSVVLHFRLLRHEQRERHRRMRRMEDEE